MRPKDFVPSQGSSSCKESLTRLTAQARKYHLGLVFATQNPKDLDHKIVANCSTHYYGKVNSPAAIDVIRDQLRLRGAIGRRRVPGSNAAISTSTTLMRNSHVH